MKRAFLLVVMIFPAFLQPAFSQKAGPWKADQLMAPAVLDSIINAETIDKPLIICVGPSALIKTSVDAGPASEAKGISRLKEILSSENKDREIVIYCGCCPFEHCPNVRPAFQLLKDLKFIHPMLLNLAHNLKTDWIDHGYAIKE
jgi:hypothetical protein